jgi:peroxiredoxin
MRMILIRTCSLLAFMIGLAVLPAASSSFQPQSNKDKGKEPDHHYAPLRETEMEIKDFSFPTLGGDQIRLSEAVRGKQLILIHFFSPWCHNSNFDVLTLNGLYQKYRDRGLQVIGVCEYSKKNELRDFLKKHQPDYTICIEGDDKRPGRTETAHFIYRKQINDERVWGTPLNILISAEDVMNEHGIVARRVRIAPGELIKDEIEKIFDETLGR